MSGWIIYYTHDVVPPDKNFKFKIVSGIFNVVIKAKKKGVV